MALLDEKLMKIASERTALLRKISIAQARVAELNTQRQNLIMSLEV